MDLTNEHCVSRQAADPRILMPTYRNFVRKAFQCGLYEAQDVLVEIDNVELIPLEFGWGRWVNQSWLRMPLYHDPSRKLMQVNPGLRKVRLTREYDLFMVICQDYSDLPYINAVDRWKDHCKTSVCWIDEIWAATIPDYKYWLHALSRFDHVFVGCKGSVETLSNAIGRPCHWLPGGADLLRFGSYRGRFQRVIDVYSVGRRSEGIHNALLRASERGEIFYVYDTAGASNTEVFDHRQHRDLYANLAKRSRYFMVAPGKINDPVTQGQVEVGYRYFEGAAAGTVMIGQVPNCDAFRQLFDWSDAVVPIATDGSDVSIILNDLASDVDRVAAIQQRNEWHALLRHDWVHRWKELFRVAGIAPLPGMSAREHRLKDLSEMVSDESRAIHEAV